METPPPPPQPPPPGYPQGYPPGYPPQPPQRGSNKTLWIVLGVGGVVGVCGCLGIGGAILFPVFAQAKEAAKQTACLSNMKQQATSLLLYANDHDDRLPRGDRWMDRIQKYTPNDEIFHCPSAGSRQYGYAMNAALAGKALTPIATPGTEIMIFESTIPGRSAVGGLETAPSPGRHRRRNNAAYADSSARSDRL